MAQEVTNNININHVNEAALHNIPVWHYSLIFLAMIASFSFLKFHFVWTVPIISFLMFVFFQLMNVEFNSLSYKTWTSLAFLINFLISISTTTCNIHHESGSMILGAGYIA